MIDSISQHTDGTVEEYNEPIRVNIYADPISLDWYASVTTRSGKVITSGTFHQNKVQALTDLAEQLARMT